MADGQAGDLPGAVKSYVQDKEDITYRLFAMGKEDGNVEKINTGVAKGETTAVPADNSPVSDAGTTKSWEVIDPVDANEEAPGA
ncbi:uncharacterized protein TRIVIDRAFT_224974 [Trichoderma virens Gv29-8]|uniref:Uncharacterized protein n=1 Tax=Hypocrea virens (strain Gv29-8 / FGSC 10586) TaxID=413071 RepID=G9N1Y6_HYPVG|nr:uncharacterized protein TRIVIDRAFT_224974 [Trichoderma virens Gv29-8]EHK19103.1 hypothetical protein TRIVIDRAFT_224974 [Trichoderma virens Gv29-8]UKZ49446.1 hypothetical protein TrVGV298_003693 [Trichoderma virens]UKZ75975.1 hypothetical protein TrVFT333_003671 [Trichoderma virens FT-333]